MASVTHNNIKVDFDSNPKVTFLQGCDMDIFTIQDNIRYIEGTPTGCMAETKMIVKIWGNENFSADGSQKDALSLMVLPPYVIDFELGAIPFSTNSGNLLGTFVQQSVMVNNAIGAVSLNSEAIEYSSFQNAVWLDNTTSTTGMVYPAGNREFPVNNLPDAVAIANERGFDTIQVLTSMTLDSGTDFRGFRIIGKSHVNTLIHIADDALCENAIIQRCRVTGFLDGGIEITDSMCGDITYVNGHIHNSELFSTIALAGNEDAVIVDCVAAELHDLPIIDMGGTGQDLVMSGWDGDITIRNMTGATEDVSIGIQKGKVTLDSTITNGNVSVGGTGIVVDNTGPAANVNTDDLINRELITKATWDKIYLDITDGTDSTTFPYGTLQFPVKTPANALAVAAASNIKAIMVAGTLTLDRDVSGYEFTSWKNGKINMNNQACLAARFRECKLYGIQASVGLVFDCRITNLQGMLGVYTDCRFLDSTPLVLAQGETHIFNSKAQTEGNIVFDLSAGTEGSPITLLLKDWVGKLEIKNSTSSTNVVDVHTSAGHITLTSNTLGKIDLEGVYELTDDDSGATVEKEARVMVEENAPSASDIASTVAAQTVEGSLDITEALKIILAATAGSSAGAGTETFEYKSVDGGTTRIRSTFDVNGNRQITLLDAS